MVSAQRHTYSTAPVPDRQRRAVLQRGLVTVHISGRAGKRTWEVKPNGAVLHVPGEAPFGDRRGDRGPIRGLSPHSRKRLLHAALGIPWGAAPAFFVTLTYHYSAGSDPAQWYRDLRAFWKRLVRDYEAFSPGILWTKEFQRRGAVHFHLVIFWRRVPHLEQYRRWVSREWNEVAELGDELHAKAGTNVRPVRTEDVAGGQRLTRYLTKHLVKRAQKQPIDPNTGEVIPTGRMWGVLGDVPQETIAVFDLDDRDLAQLHRRLRRWRRSSPFFQRFGKGWSSGVVMAESDVVLQLVRGLGSSSTGPVELPP